MTVSELPAYTGSDGVCAKCGWRDAESSYREGVPDIRRAGDETVFITANDDAQECIVRSCRNCEYEWVEACIEQS